MLTMSCHRLVMRGCNTKGCSTSAHIPFSSSTTHRPARLLGQRSAITGLERCCTLRPALRAGLGCVRAHIGPGAASLQPGSGDAPIDEPKAGGKGGQALALAAAALGVVGTLVLTTSYGPVVKSYLSNSVLGKSGFLAAFSLIFLSEIGDKTFFIAALLAMKCGKWVSFAGSTAALAVMTVISVAIGMAFKHVPDALTTSIPVGEYLGVALLVYFGVRTLKDAWDLPAEGGSVDGELDAATSSVEAAEVAGTLTKRTPWQSFMEVASLIFVAEWGDRSMLATVALGAAQSPLGVASGAIMAHAGATLIAVLGGAIASRYVSEKTVGYTGGVLFLLFAAATMLGIY